MFLNTAPKMFFNINYFTIASTSGQAETRVTHGQIPTLFNYRNLLTCHLSNVIETWHKDHEATKR